MVIYIELLFAVKDTNHRQVHLQIDLCAELTHRLQLRLTLQHTGDKNIVVFLKLVLAISIVNVDTNVTV